MKQIEEGIFDSCEKLQTVTILDGVTEIGNYSFYHCIGLTKIILPNSITSIGDLAFADCDNLEIIKKSA